MRRSKRVAPAEEKELANPQPPSPAHAASSSSSSSSTLDLSFPLPPSPLASLPPAAVDRLQGYLGFALLIDLRCLSRSAARECEDAALQWMNHHLVSTPTDVADLSFRTPPRTPPPFCFRRPDAVWFRRQLSRWRFDCVHSDEKRCAVGLAEVRRTYGLPWPTTSSLTSSYTVKAVARELFEKRGHATAFARQLETEKAQRMSGLSERLHKHRMAKEKGIVRRWTAGWPFTTSLMLLVPTAVARHSILSLLSFEELMELRVLSHELRPLLEAAVVARLGQMCPSGLATIARQEATIVRQERESIEQGVRWQEELARISQQRAEQERLLADRRLNFFSPKRKRLDASSPVHAHAAASSIPSSSSSTRPFSSSSSTSSPSVSLHASAPLVPPLPSAATTPSPSSPPSSPSALLPVASYTLAHCVWAMQQLQWCRRINYNALKLARRPREPVEPLLCRSHFISRFPLWGPWRERFGWPSLTGAFGSGTDRRPMVEVLDVLLGEFGRVVEGPERRSRKKKQRLAEDKRPEDDGEGQDGSAVNGVVAYGAGCPTRVESEGCLRCWRCRFMYEVGAPGTPWQPRPVRFL